MLSVDKALEIVLAQAPVLTAERVPLTASVGRVLAEPVLADRDVPPADRSAMDGYAVRAADTASGAAHLTVDEEIFAGDVPTRPLSSGQTAKIMTGAPIPEGADSVVMVEYTRPGAAGQVQILEKARAGQHVISRAEFASRGDRLLETGRVLQPMDVGILAFTGVTNPSVYRQPTVAVFSTGDELVEPSQAPSLGQIRNSNAYCLAAQLQTIGVQVEILGIGRDEPEMLSELVRRGLEADVLLSSGGVSVGEKDFVEQLLHEHGVKTLFSKMAIKPGKPTVFGHADSALVFGLPGNPLSAMVTCELLVLSAVRKMMGYAEPHPRWFRVRRGSGAARRSDRRQFIPARLRLREGELEAELVRSQGSGDLFSVTSGDGLAIFMEEQDPPPTGEFIEFLPFVGCALPAAEGDRTTDTPSLSRAAAPIAERRNRAVWATPSVTSSAR